MISDVKKYMGVINSKQVRLTHHVYVVELSKEVWRENRKFRNANPQYNGVLECLYVGMTSNTPAERFKKHKTGYRTKKGIKISSYYVEKYGRYLRPSLYSKYNPLTKNKAAKLEEELSLALRRKGYAVWFN